MLSKATEELIKSLKRDPSYTLDPRLHGRKLVQTLMYRGTAYIRGQWYRIWLGKVTGRPFVGAGVSLRYPQLISLGRSVIIEDHVTMDALSEKGICLGDNVTIARFTTIQCTGVIRDLGVGLEVGDNSAIGAYTFIGAQGGIKIGSNVIMGPMVSFHAENHKYDRVDVPIRLQGETREGIQVEDDCWIGAGSKILDGVHIGPGCVVAAGSVVSRSVPACSVVAGVPAKIVKERSQR